MKTCLQLLAMMFGLQLVSASAAASESGLVPPDGYMKAVHFKRSSASACDDAPKPYTGKMNFPSKYEGSGAARDELNEASEAEYKRRTASITNFEKGVVSLITKYMKSGDPELLQCVMYWLSSWADADALEGQAATHTGRSIRKWTLGSLSSAYLRLKFSSTRPLKESTAEARRVELWFSKLADLVAKEWSPDDPIKKINNHYYWVAWSLMATAVVSDRRDLFDQAVTYYRIFSKQVDSEGYLPNELNRATRALGYHVYALGPIAMIAAFAKANGIDLAKENDKALDRLVHRVMLGVDNPKIFEEKVHMQQDPDSISDKSTWLWIEPYCWTVKCEPPLSERRAAVAPQKSTRLGGDLTAVFNGSAVP